MKCNVGNTDRTLRLIVGCAIIGAGVFYHNWLGAIGFVPLLTATIRFCPAYTILGIRTNK